MNEIAIVILSYTRPREVKKLIELCKKINFKKIYVCVDGNSNKSIKNEFLKLKKEYKDAIFYIREDNLGIRYGITDFIKKIFENEEASIFIEEDLNLNTNSLDFLVNNMYEYAENKDISSVCLFSPLSLDTKYKNESNYLTLNFFPTGWGSWKNRGVELNILQNESYLTIIKVLTKLFKFRIIKILFWFKRFYDYKNFKVDAWSYNHIYKNFKYNQYSIIPKNNLVTHEIFDEFSVNMFNKKIGIYNKQKLYNMENSVIYSEFDKKKFIIETALMYSLNLRGILKKIEKKIFR